MITYIYCWRTGEIDTAPKPMVGGLLYLGAGDPERVSEVIAGTARRAYDGQTWLVPGIPEADTDDAALAAAQRYRSILLERLA